MWNIFKSKRRRILEATDYGRSDGWYVEHNSKRIAHLKNPKFHDMFWYSYEIEIFDKSLTEKVKTYLFWDSTNLKFFSISLEEYCDNPVIVTPVDESNEFLIRGLYISN